MIRRTINTIKKALPSNGYGLIRNYMLSVINSISRIPNYWFHFRHSTTPFRLIIVVGSGHRVGSSWFYRLVKDMAHCEFGRQKLPKELYSFGLIKLNKSGFEYLGKIKGHQIFKTHSAPPKNEKEASSANFLSIYRDPRDVVTSLSYYLAEQEESKGGWGKEFAKDPIEQRILKILESPQFLTEQQVWFETPYAFKVRYEDLKSDPETALLTIARHLKIKADPAAINKVLLKYDFQKLKNNKTKNTNKKVEKMRKGMVGDWQNHFDLVCEEKFKKAQNGQWNKLLVDMGYEQSPDWGQATKKKQLSNK